jgi:DNA polymerase-3 subunit alpha
LKDAAPAVAVTDTNNLFGALEFAQKAVKDGLQPIIGCQLDVAFDDGDPGIAAASYQMRHRRRTAVSAGPDRGHRDGLRQSRAAGQPRLSGQCRPGDPPHVDSNWTDFAVGRPDLPDGRRARAGRGALKADHGRSSPKAGCSS